MSKRKKRINHSSARSAKTVLKPTPRPDWWWLAVFAAAFAARLIFVWHSRRLPFFFSPIIDAQRYDPRAMELIQNGGVKDDSQRKAWRVATPVRVASFRRTQLPRLRSWSCRGSGGAFVPVPLPYLADEDIRTVLEFAARQDDHPVLPSA
jgi:hypothetical protein